MSLSAKKREKKLKNVILVQEVKKPMDDYKQKLSYIKGGGNPLDLCLKQSVIMNFWIIFSDILTLKLNILDAQDNVFGRSE